MEGRVGVRDVEGEGCCKVRCSFSSCKIERTLRFANDEESGGRKFGALMTIRVFGYTSRD